MKEGPTKQWASYLITMVAIQGTLLLIVTVVYLLNK